MARILVVDDEQSQRLALTTMLRGAGHEALEADGVKSAMARCSDGIIDIVITDLQMPGTHGLEFITMLLDLDQRPIIVAVSGTGSDQLSVAEGLGADATLPKPVFADELLRAVDEALTEDETPTLVISDPPHRNIDLDAVAALIGLDVFQTRLKFNFSAPEVLAASDRRRASQMAGRLKEAGVRLDLIDGEGIAGMPWPDPVSIFAFTDSGLTATLHDRAITLPYDTPGTAVYASLPKGPPSKARRSQRGRVGIEPELLANPGPSLADAMEQMGSVDVYYEKDGVLQRISIVEHITDFSGLGEVQRDTPAENLETTLVECQRRFSRMHFDTRLEGVRPRRRFEPGDMATNSRQRYSFGTPQLREVLESVSPELGRLTQFELGSRLGYLTNKNRPPSWKD